MKINWKKAFSLTLAAALTAVAAVAAVPASAAVIAGIPAVQPAAESAGGVLKAPALLFQSAGLNAPLGAALLGQSLMPLSAPFAAAALNPLNPAAGSIPRNPATAQEAAATPRRSPVQALSPRAVDALEAAGRSVGRTVRNDGDASTAGKALDALFTGAGPGLGIDVSAMDASVRPQDDFYRYVNGTWLKNYTIPADKSRFGAFDQLGEKSETAVKEIVQGLSSGRHEGGTDEQKISDLYKSFMNTDVIEARGLHPLAGELKTIEELPDKAALVGAFARAGSSGVATPIGLSVGQDSKDPASYVAGVDQSGLGLPNRDYYFKTDEETGKVRQQYLAYVTTLLKLSGEEKAAEKAAAVFALEKSLARHQWTDVELRDPVKAYNKTAVRDLGAVAPGFDWSAYLRAAGIRPEEADVIVGQPSYLAGFASVLADQPLESWKLYLKVRTLDASASYLPKAYEDAAFAYHGFALNGQPQMRPRWKRGVSLVNGAVGELIGKIYVSERFSQSSRTRMRTLVENLRAAFRERILSRDWMGEATKQKALEKLDKFTKKIGYPDRWKDYSPLRIDADDLLGNVRRSNTFDYSRMVEKLGRPVDRGEWGMNPQTVNAYYSPVMNEIVFPAAILLAPFFDPLVDDAVNYGAIGAVIGHEMTHGFDDQGAQFDGDGRLKSWWPAEDEAAFQSRTAKLAAEFDAFEPLPGQHVNGKLTLGENIADLGGMTIAYRAYQLALAGAAAAIIDGFTGPQRFFMSWAQVWRSAIREKALRGQLANDPHSPAEYRVNGVVRNMPEFYEAFGLKPGDKLYQPEKDRVGIW